MMGPAICPWEGSRRGAQAWRSRPPTPRESRATVKPESGKDRQWPFPVCMSPDAGAMTVRPKATGEMLHIRENSLVLKNRQFKHSQVPASRVGRTGNTVRKVS